MADMQDLFRHMVPAADLVRNFGQWRDQALAEPVVVTIHGRRSHVIVGYDNYLAATGGGDGSPTAAPANPVDASVMALFDSVRDCVIVIAPDYTILRVNHAAEVHLCQSEDMLVGREFMTMFPRANDSFAISHLKRALDHHETFSGDIPNPGRPGFWLRVDLVPVAAGAAIIFRDVTEEVTGQQRVDVRQTILQAMELDGGIGCARLSVRETVEEADAGLLAMLGLSEAALRRVRFSTIIPATYRPAFAAAIEAVFARQGPQRIDTQLLANDGRVLNVRMSLLELRGAYASEGAIVLVTPREGQG